MRYGAGAGPMAIAHRGGAGLAQEKDRAGLGPLVTCLQRRGVAERVCIAGAWDGWLAHVRREVPEVTTALG
jgi:hypothetical protein